MIVLKATERSMRMRADNSLADLAAQNVSKKAKVKSGFCGVGHFEARVLKIFRVLGEKVDCLFTDFGKKIEIKPIGSCWYSQWVLLGWKYPC